MLVDFRLFNFKSFKDEEEKFRGNGYASKACNLIKIVAKSHGMNSLLITCNPDN